jgi:hypothetical protein
MSNPPGMKVNAQGTAGDGVEFSLINETGQGIVVTLFLVPVPPTPQLDGETWPSFTVPPASRSGKPIATNDTHNDSNLTQFLYPAPRGVYNAFVQVDKGLYEVGAGVVVSATGALSDRRDAHADGMC